MSSDEVDKKNEEEMKDTASSVDEEEEKQEAKVEKTNNKAGSKKKGADPPKIKQPAKKRVKTAPVDEKKEDSDKEESEDEDTKVPLLDQPLEVTGRRRRSEVQRFKPAEEESKDKELKIPEGKGLALGDIEGIDDNIQKSKPEDLKVLHRICFGKIGKANEVKKNLKRFNGFEFDRESNEYDSRVKKMIGQKFSKVQLTVACQVLKLDKSGAKDDLLLRVLEFLVSPDDHVDTEEKAPKTEKKTKKTTAAKKGKKGGRKKAKESEDEEEDEESIDSFSEAEEKHEEKNGKESNDKDNSTEESDPDKDNKGSDKEEELKKDKKESEEKKAPPKKRAAAKKAAVEKNSDSEEAKEDKKSDCDKSDDEPLEKKPKPSPPSDDEIKAYVKGLLDGADLEQITMKKVCQDVYAHYPHVDLTHKKDFIKTTVKNIISS